ncbi:septum site-determining protein MinC [Lysinibacillus sp. HST-98]|uniref:Probable septum site-determining protein MinC n=1 Tax=Lysinibacillus capsici TaxID=2115968 RepID=A0A2X1BTD4_9BACI|nr:MULTISPECIES: septum site-determining protein MinC [Lysinibacillus]EFI69389.1 septum formation inhibitor [Lysinibacillus fusiformis ZC1]EKU41486.1 septum formation inhibitor [Lysinibacillus fusiformis ZB2]WHP41908.1 septum site-determining protein MinC [Lysinibacillus boronitolerans]AUS87694.1 septum site-determining protein MinC [Lysinibacillus sp. YS11]KMN37666.1 septum site-determining protein MinC [Lysinibacillus sp. LK3]
MKKQLVNMKGTKDGFVLRLDDQCAYGELVEELKNKVLEGGIDGKVDVQLYLGYRYCTEEQLNELIKIIEETEQLIVSKVQSEVLTVHESNQKMFESQQDTYIGVVRSGQILRSSGDITIIGNVNPNGRVEAGGNVYVLGRLKGIAHAGMQGNKEAIIAASRFEATHIMIADQVQVMSDEHVKAINQVEMTCAFIGYDGRITYDQIHALKNIRPLLNVSKGGS